MNRFFNPEKSTDALINILIVDDDKESVDFISHLLKEDYHLLHAASAEEAYPVLLQNKVGMLICSEYLPTENGLMFMARMSKEFSKTQPILMSEGITEDLLAFAINDIGVLKYLKKPLNEQPLINAINCAREHYLEALDNETLKHAYHAIIEETQSLPYMARRVKEATPIIISNIATSATAASGTLILILTLTTVFSFTAMLCIYSFKIFLGIDFFSTSHISDLFN